MKRSLSFPLQDSERKALLVLLDLGAVNLALFLSLALRPDYELSVSLFARGPHWFILFSLIWFLVASVFDLYDLSVASSLQSSSIKIFEAGIIACGIFILIPYITPLLPPGRRYLLLFFILVIGFVFCLRLTYTRVISRPFLKRRGLIIGTGWETASIAKVLHEYGRNAYEIVGAIQVGVQKKDWPMAQKSLEGKLPDAISEGKKIAKNDSNDSLPNNEQINLSDEIEHNLTELEKNKKLPENPAFLPTIGSISDLKNLIQRYDIKTLILAYPGDMNGVFLQAITDCLELGVEIVPMASLYERFTGRVPVEHVGDQWYVAMPINHPGTGTLWPLAKRCADIILASLGFVFLAPIAPFIALAIYIDSPGPIFYVQDRIGKGGRLFKAIKFRTMLVGADKNGPAWTLKMIEE